MKKALSALLIGTLILTSITACGKESEDAEAKAPKSAAEKPTTTTATPQKTATQTPASESTATPDTKTSDFDTLFGDPLPERSTYVELTEPVAEDPWVDRQVIDRSNPDVAAALEAYKAVFSNSMNFSFTYDEDLERYKESMSLSELADFFNTYHGATLSHFALIDLDCDNVPEVVLVFGYYRDQFVVLRHHNERVNAFYFYIRSFNRLKKDGTFSASAGAMTNSRSKISFIRETYMIEDYIYSSNGIYYVYGKQVTEEEYGRAVAKENSKPDVAWHEYTDDNITKFFP